MATVLCVDGDRGKAERLCLLFERNGRGVGVEATGRTG